MVDYLICASVSIAETVAMVIFCLYKEKLIFCKSTAEDSEIATEVDTTETTSDSYFSVSQSIFIVLLSILIFGAVNFFLYKNVPNWLGFAKLSIVALITEVSAITDFKKRIIPNALIVFGLAFRVLIYVLESIFCPHEILAIFKNDLIGFAVGFGVLFLACIISKKSIGFGDVKLFGVIGICTGAICTYTTLLFGLVINTIVSLFAMLIKKKNKKDSIPFAPAVCIGYLVSIFISSF